MCPLYVSGLIGPGDRKSVQPMAKRLALGACDQLHHFMSKVSARSAIVAFFRGLVSKSICPRESSLKIPSLRTNGALPHGCYE